MHDTSRATRAERRSEGRNRMMMLVMFQVERGEIGELVAGRDKRGKRRASKESTGSVSLEKGLSKGVEGCCLWDVVV